MSSHEPSVLRRFFAGVAEHTFQTQLGVADPPLIDYLSDLLTRFVGSESIYRFRNLTGKPLREVADMLTEAHARVGEAKRDLHRHIGDFTLFWTGVYPEAVERLRAKSPKDQCIDYCTEGKKSYWIASTLVATESPNLDTEADVLGRLSQHFELCAYGLREVRRQWEQREDDPPIHHRLLF